MEITDTAQKLLEARYFLRDQEGELIEHDWEELCRRVASFVANTKREEDEYFEIMHNLLFLPSSPQLMYLGTKCPMPSSCFVLGPIEDDLDSILGVLHDACLAQKHSGGSGYNFSRLRPQGNRISTTGGESSGPVSFMELYDQAMQVVVRAGKKQGAQMAVLNCDHPEIFKFIRCKDDNDALPTFNVSVGITDDFMSAVENDDDWDLVFNGDVYETVRARDIWHEIARRAWENGDPGVLFLDTANRNNKFDRPIEAANPCVTGDTKVVGPYLFTMKELAEDGRGTPVLCYDGSEIISRMGRQPRRTGKGLVLQIGFEDGGSIKTTHDHKFMLANGEYAEAKDLLIGDKVMSMNMQCDTYGLEVNSVKSAGLQDVYNITVDDYHNLAYMVGDSSAVITANCGEITAPNNSSCNLGAINLSLMVENGKINMDKLSKVTKASIRFLDGVLDKAWWPIEEITENAQRDRNIGLGVMGFADALIKMGVPYDSEKGVEFGRLIMAFIQMEAEEESNGNVTLTSIAPTGSRSFIAGCSAGIEPIFGVVSINNTKIGSFYNVHPLFEQIAKERGFYSDELVERIAREGTVQTIDEVPDDVKRLFKTATEIGYEWHIEMQSAFQCNVDTSISKTINLPNDATIQDVKDAFMLAYDMQCKSVTVYRDGSRKIQPLENKDNNHTCPECNARMTPTEGCWTCSECGYSVCSIV